MFRPLSSNVAGTVASRVSGISLAVLVAAAACGAQSASAQPFGFGFGNASAQSATASAIDLATVLRGATMTPNVTWTRWSDPTDGAFAAEVPAGWAVQGGVVRTSALGVHPVLQLRSPDGAIAIRYGDPAVPAFSLPNRVGAQLGMREGQPGAGGYVTRHYQTGAQFALDYAGQAADRMCGGRARIEQRDLPQLSAPANEAAGRAGLPTHNDTGAVMFSCVSGAPATAVLVVATTSVIPNPGGDGGIWTVPFLAVLTAPLARMTEANAIGTHIVRSVATNPQWGSAQLKATGAITAHNVEAANEQFEIQQRIARERTASMMRQAESGDRVIRGVQEMQAPGSGTRYEVQIGSSYHWIDPNGQAVGTNTPNNPDATRYQLMQAPQR